VHVRRVLDDDHQLALKSPEAEFGDCSCAVGEEALFVG
jgi:hypothetical protein